VPPPSGYGSGYGGGGYGRSSDGGGYGGGGYGGGYGAGQQQFDESGFPVNPVAYKLFRFFDYTVDQGKAYKYRVQLSVEDPNFPSEPMMAARAAELDRSVVNRLKALHPNGIESVESRIYWRLTDWSEESDVIRVGSDERVIAGKVRAPAPKSVKVNNQSVAYENPDLEPEVDLIVVDFDGKETGDIPAEKTGVKRGSMANFRSDAERIDVVKMQLKEVKAHQFNSNVLVVDIMGGEALPGGRDSKDRLSAPGEALLMTPTGKLVTHSELKESRDYYYNIFPKETKWGADGYGPGAEEDTAGRGRGRGNSGYGSGGSGGYGGGGYGRGGYGGGGYGAPPARKGRRGGGA
jgi:hypothetical protein